MYLIAYDISDPKRRRKVQKIAYSYALGGQKSAVEALLKKSEIFEVARQISAKMDLENDRAHIVKVKKFIFLGTAKEITFDKGDIVI
ncbi:MAG: CRISPR-associated endonuclease Cas2 [Epsilonproteobacteria bacterium]|jgi:CRISPR-associated protein Cas2|nr:CRISPR-associated endonuclease Cas2 [Campylobacterota bacterium]